MQSIRLGKCNLSLLLQLYSLAHEKLPFSSPVHSIQLTYFSTISFYTVITLNRRQFTFWHPISIPLATNLTTLSI